MPRFQVDLPRFQVDLGLDEINNEKVFKSLPGSARHHGQCE